MIRTSGLGRWAIHHSKAIVFITLILCLAGLYAAVKMPSSVFPQTNFPRVVILVDNGVMPGDEMMATVTRPIEEAMKDIPGAVTIRSATGRGAAEINVFFTWDVDMIQSELYVLGRLAQIRGTLPVTATSTVWRLTFSAFPIIGVSLTSPTRDITGLWEEARYDLKPRFLRIPGVARVDLVGGRTPEYHVIVDPLRLQAAGLSLAQVTDALVRNNLISPAGLLEEDYTLYLTVVDGRLRTPEEIENLTVGVAGGRSVAVKDFARVERGPEPVFNVVTADGVNAVLLNIRSQPDGSTLNIAHDLQAELAKLRHELPPDMKLAFFYDQSQLVRGSVGSVWEAIAFGLILSVAIIYLFLKNWGTTLVAVVVIPVTVLVTLVAMKLAGLSFNLMTLGGIAAAIGLVIDDAIVVVEAIYAKIAIGRPRVDAIAEAVGEIFAPLLASTLTPVVVFLPLAFLVGLAGVFFRALALTMVVSLLTSLLLAITLTPALAAWLIRDRAHLEHGHAPKSEEGGPLLGRLIRTYEFAVRRALRFSWLTLLVCFGLLAAGVFLYQHLESDFLPEMDEGGFVIDYVAPWGTSLAETSRQLDQAEEIIRSVPEIESYSRRTGARLALAIAEPNTGDFLVKLRSDRKRSTEDVKSELRHRFNAAVPGMEWEFPGILSDLVGDLTWSPQPIEVKLFSTDLEFLKKKAPEIESTLKEVKGVVDTFDGLTMTGPSLSLRVRHLDAQRFGLNADDIAAAVNTAMLGRTASSVLEGDRVVNIRVLVDRAQLGQLETLRNLPMRMPAGGLAQLSQVADLTEEPGQLELRREDLRQNVAVTARLEGRDLGSAMAEIREKLARDKSLPAGTIEFGGLFQQQQESFRNLLFVLATAILLVFTVLLIEFRSYHEPIAIVFGSVLSLLGTVLALWITGTTLNIVSFLGAIIGVGIVAKNGILMLDYVDHLRAEGATLDEALVRSGHRRLRPVLMTSLAAGLGMLPLAYGIGSGADMLKPLAIGIIGALCFSMLFSLIATPVIYRLLAGRKATTPRLAQAASLLVLTLFAAGCERSPSGSSSSPEAAANSPSDQFLSLMNAGKNYLDQGDSTNAIAIYKKAEAIVPNDADLRLNLANSYLVGGAAEEAIREANEALKLEPNSAAAYFIKGSAYLRLSNPEEAAKALENAKTINPGETATLFQLGRARIELKQWDGAIAAFKEGLRMDPNRLHAAAHYLLGQALLRAGREEEAKQEFQLHQVNLEGGGPPPSVATFERTRFTQARVPFKLDQPEKEGIKIRFIDATKETLGDGAQKFSGPVGIINGNQKAWTSLFVVEKGQGFRVLRNNHGVFRPDDALYPAIPGASYFKMLVGDLQNDRFDDIVVLGDKGSHLFKLGTNGVAIDATAPSGLSALRAIDGILMDLDFTGKLDLIAVTGNTSEVRVFRQLGPLLFNDLTSTSGVPASLQDAHAVMMEDWNRDGNMDVIASRKAGPPLLLEKQRGGPLVPRESAHWVSGAIFSTGDFDNDLRPDLAVVSDGKITVCSNGGERKELPGNGAFNQIVAIDYDNDGWLDLWAVGEKIRVWRNLGLSGFQEQTAQLGLDKFDSGAVSEIQFADFDRDCDSDVIVALANGGLRYLRNEGGNANAQVKVQMIGNRSNASGIGCKVEIATGGLRLTRTVHRLPVEVGVGKHQKLDSFLVHWFNWPQGSAEITFDCKEPIFALELTIQEGSCPYLYAWDGKGFRFGTDILGAAPLGLPVAEGRYIESDPEELVWLGNEQTFPPREGKYQLQITEELREVLYLDEAKLVVVDHEPGTETLSTDKLLPGKPFPRGTILTLENEHPLQRAETLDGQEVSSRLIAVDGQRVSPGKLRVPQLRGLAEPHGLILDFGPLDASRRLVLVMNGWLRFGGGMANIAASHDPSLPFPFPTLEAEVAPGTWKALDVTVGAPAGKTKTILVDLEGKLEAGTHRLRLTEAFEIHWDRIALMEKKPDARTQVTFITPSEADLHFRGFSPPKPLPPDWPLTPDYDTVSSNSYWTVTPGGWCTRYGDVSELIAFRDEGLALLNGGDELSLKFAVSSLPPKPPGSIREFFLYVDGWDKDSDFHVATGTAVEPLPFHGMDDQLYGRERRPQFPSDALHRKYNTRWVEGRVVKQTASH